MRNTKFHLTNGLIATIDPNNKYLQCRGEDLFEFAGIIPSFISNDINFTFQEECEKNYMFGLMEMEGGVVKDDNSYVYPEDPTLHPIVQFTKNDEVMNIYEYGIVSFVRDGKSFVCRMD